MHMNSSKAEADLWNALEMEKFGNAMKDADPMAPIMFGTGHTVNSCYQCDNSLRACSAGESNCNPRIAQD